MQCKECKKKYEIGQVGKSILVTLKITLPKLCDECSMRHLFSFRNERTFYSRKCDKCQKDIMAMYPAKTDYTVYCRDCWWGDKWDATKYARNYSGPEKFFDELKEMQKEVPREALVNLNSENCDYCNHIRDSKDCYMCSLIADKCEAIFNGYWITNSKNSSDSYYLRDSERCYFCIATIRSYDCSYLLECEDCIDCHYNYDLRGCKNCMFSSNLRNQNYMFKNKQLTEDEYKEKIEQIERGSYKESEKYYNQWKELIKNSIHVYSNQTKCENSTGDNMQNCVNTENGYNSFENENCYNAASFLHADHVYAGLAVGSQPVQWSYNAVVTKGGSNVINCFNTAYSSDIYYSENLVSCMDCLGCNGLHHKKFCILNKEYEEDEYKKIKQELIKYWTENKIISDFFPQEFSCFGINETAANDFYPIEKEDALKRGYKWKDDMPGNFNKDTIKIENIEDNINEVKDDIIKKTLGCKNCGRNYKVIKPELELYRDLNIPISRECIDCKLRKRLDLMGDRNLVKRSCDKCKKEVLTKHKQDSKNVLCESCYQKKIY
ncbi:MAG: hypothetical protein ABID45_01575 [Patescibacteria group bacterium]